MRQILSKLTFKQVLTGLLVIVAVLVVIQLLFPADTSPNLQSPNPQGNSSPTYINEFENNKDFVDPESDFDHVGAPGDSYPTILFPEFVNDFRPTTDSYEIYPDGNNSYLVVLKNGYSQKQFQKEVLSYFPDASKYKLRYVSRE